jgi:steroid delta-isomerase
MTKENLAIVAHKNSIANAMAGDKEKWLALFDPNAVVHDPVGPSEHDPEGRGSRGIVETSAFWDRMIGPGNLTIVPHKRIPCGYKVAAVIMTAANNVQGTKTYIEMVGVYEVNDVGKLTSLNIYWDVDALGDQLRALGVSS